MKKEPTNPGVKKLLGHNQKNLFLQHAKDVEAAFRSRVKPLLVTPDTPAKKDLIVTPSNPVK